MANKIDLNNPYIKYLYSQGRSNNTIYRYQKCYERFNKSYPFTQEGINSFFLNRRFNNSVARAFMKSFLEFMDLTGQYTMPPLRRVKKRKIITPVIPQETLEKIRHMAYSQSFTKGFLLDIIYFGAMRRSEIENLKVNSFDWIKWSEDPTKSIEILIKDAKGKKDRMVLIPAETIAKFILFLSKRNKIPMGEDTSIEEVAGKLSMNEDYLFQNAIGGAMDGSKIYNLVQKLCRDANVSAIRPHQLRHFLDEGSLILTAIGWKNYKEIKEGDLIYTFSLKNKLIEIKPIKNIFIGKPNGDMNRIKNNWLDYLCGNEHYLIIRLRKAKSKTTNRIKDRWDELGNWERIKMEDLLKKRNIRTIQHKLSGIYSGNLSIGKEKAGILGWILTDGSINKRKSSDISISQSFTANKEKCDYIRELLTKSRLNYSEHKQKIRKNTFSKKDYEMITFRILQKNVDWIFEFINRDRTPKWNLLNLKHEELEELYKCMMMGDGTRNQEFCNQNPKRIEFFRVLCCLLGKNTILGSKIQNGKKYYRVYIQKKDYCTIIPKKHLSKEKYKGKVWCISNENQTYIVKSNEKIFITGNTRATEMEDKGLNLRSIQHYLGHSSPQITEVYLHTQEKQSLEKVREVFDKE